MPCHSAETSDEAAFCDCFFAALDISRALGPPYGSSCPGGDSVPHIFFLSLSVKEVDAALAVLVENAALWRRHAAQGIEDLEGADDRQRTMELSNLDTRRILMV
jgi:hypothetical protein